ncbi:MAG: DUF3842 family protein [Bacilli bacterium]|jgi:hypothetical protein
MRILVIDGQGGKLGAEVINLIKNKFEKFEIIAVGTNALATQAMLKAGASVVATGENPVVVNAKKVDVIIGPLGIVIADAFHGEVTPKMALAVAQAEVKRIFIPMNKCDNIVAGLTNQTMGDILEDIIKHLDTIYKDMV